MIIEITKFYNHPIFVTNYYNSYVNSSSSCLVQLLLFLHVWIYSFFEMSRSYPGHFVFLLPSVVHDKTEYKVVHCILKYLYFIFRNVHLKQYPLSICQVILRKTPPIDTVPILSNFTGKFSSYWRSCRLHSLEFWQKILNLMDFMKHGNQIFEIHKVQCTNISKNETKWRKNDETWRTKALGFETECQFFALIRIL